MSLSDGHVSQNLFHQFKVLALDGLKSRESRSLNNWGTSDVLDFVIFSNLDDVITMVAIHEHLPKLK